LKNESLLGHLLENPRVYSTPGMVELIVSRVRFPGILSRIASQHHLHTGQANRGVPFALLKSPCMIPMGPLRALITTRYINIAELKQIARNPYGVRKQVHDEVKQYLQRRG
jgi:hypothetical protein